MATGELHEISEAIGELRAGQRAATDDIRCLNGKLDRVLAALAAVNGLPRRVEDLESQAVKLGMERAKAAGFVAGVSAVVSGAVSAAAALFR